jgi:hypothetical protein
MNRVVPEPAGIGLLNEKPLHASLRQWYSQPGDRHEVAVDGFVIDIVREKLLIEIQTRNFSAIRQKLARLVHSQQVRLIYPIVQEKWIVRSPAAAGSAAVRRRSPKAGRIEDLFWEMVSIPHLMSNPNFSLEVLMIRAEEARREAASRRWRRKNWILEARRLLEVVDRRVFKDLADWRTLLPAALECQSFTTGELAATTGTRRELAQKMAYCLCKAGVIERIGKSGRADLYQVREGRRRPAGSG